MLLSLAYINHKPDLNDQNENNCHRVVPHIEEYTHTHTLHHAGVLKSGYKTESGSWLARHALSTCTLRYESLELDVSVFHWTSFSVPAPVTSHHLCNLTLDTGKSQNIVLYLYFLPQLSSRRPCWRNIESWQMSPSGDALMWMSNNLTEKLGKSVNGCPCSNTFSRESVLWKKTEQDRLLKVSRNKCEMKHWFGHKMN